MASNKKTVLITGCSQGGIGAALALEYQQRGYHVFATTRNTKKIPSSVSSQSNVTSLALDVTSSQSIDDAAKEVAETTGGRLDVLVNNSGAALTAPTLDTDIEHARNMFEVNVLGVLAVIKAFTPLLMHGKDPCIVNNSSINGETNLPFSGKSQYHSVASSLGADHFPKASTALPKQPQPSYLKPSVWSSDRWASES